MTRNNTNVHMCQREPMRYRNYRLSGAEQITTANTFW